MTPEPSERSRIEPPPGPPWPPCPPKKRSKKSSNGFSSSPPGPCPCPPGTPPRRCGFLIVDSVLMLTTEGSSCLEICENWFDSCCGAGTVSGDASEEELFFS